MTIVVNSFEELERSNIPEEHKAVMRTALEGIEWASFMGTGELIAYVTDKEIVKVLDYDFAEYIREYQEQKLIEVVIVPTDPGHMYFIPFEHFAEDLLEKVRINAESA